MSGRLRSDNGALLARAWNSTQGPWRTLRLEFRPRRDDKFVDGVEYLAVEYRSVIKTIIEEIEYDSALMTDHRQVWVDVAHV